MAERAYDEAYSPEQSLEPRIDFKTLVSSITPETLFETFLLAKDSKKGAELQELRSGFTQWSKSWKLLEPLLKNIIPEETFDYRVIEELALVSRARANRKSAMAYWDEREQKELDEEIARRREKIYGKLTASQEDQQFNSGKVEAYKFVTEIMDTYVYIQDQNKLRVIK